MADIGKRPGWLLQSIAFVVVATPTFFIGMVIAVLPCFDDVPGPYCSVHGGWAIFAGLALGLLLSIASGVGCVWALRRSFAGGAVSSSGEK